MVSDGTGAIAQLPFLLSLMRKLVTHFTITALTFCLGLSKPAFAQLANGDFETQYPNTPPSVEDNIQPNNSGVDQLPNWSVPLQVTATSYGAIGTFAGFEATNAALATGMNPAQPFYYATFPSAPHNNSTGRVGIKRSPTPGDFQNDGMIMQQVTLTPGHQYQVSFWALKTSYAQYKSKMAFSVINSSSAPLFDNRQSVNSLVPAPYQVITSNYITDTNDWTQVTGTFTASASPSGTNTWVVVGFDRSGSTFDASIGNPGSGSNTNYVIDDVSLMDMGCATVATPGPIRGQYNTPPGRIRATISAVPGATSYDWYVNGTLQDTHAVSILFDLSNISDCNTPEIVDVQAISGTCKSQMVQRYFYPICPEGKSSSVSMAEKTPVAYPNPATELIRIPDDVKDAVLLNSAGKPVRSVDKSGMLDVQSVPAGLYNLQMMQDGKLINQRIQVKH